MSDAAGIRLVALASLAVAVLGMTGPAAAQAPLFEVEKGDATKLMKVNDDGGFVLQGTLGSGTIPASGAGTRLMWYPAKAALRAGNTVGHWDDANIGAQSVAFGSGTTAKGGFSMAAGNQTTASGGASTAMGSQTTASGENAVAMGIRTVASGFHAVAVGYETRASGFAAAAMGASTSASGNQSTAMGAGTIAAGDNSTAMGIETTASGNSSTAMGSDVVAAGDGSFAYGDRSVIGTVLTAAENQFVVRASGGFAFRSRGDLGTGCNLNAGEGTFVCTSSRLAKEGFEDVDGEAMLERLATIPIQRWRYIGTKAAHVGPTAEDFHTAFGLGEGSTTIATVDSDGISLVAVQALERRTAALREENTTLRAELTALRGQVDALAARADR